MGWSSEETENKKGMTYEEAAAALGVSRQAVGSRLNRARRKLRFALEGSDEHDPA